MKYLCYMLKMNFKSDLSSIKNNAKDAFYASGFWFGCSTTYAATSNYAHDYPLIQILTAAIAIGSATHGVAEISKHLACKKYRGGTRHQL